MFRKASGLSVASLVGSALAIPASFLVARWLGPKAYGEGQFVVLCYFYAALLRSGIFEGAVRSLIDRMARGQDAGAIRDQNIGVTIELVVSVVPGIALAVLALTISPSIRQLGFFLAPLAVIASSGNMFLASLWSARDRFDLVARMSLLRAILGPVLLVALVVSFGAAGVFLAPLGTDLAAGTVYLLVRPSLGLRLAIDIRRARALVRVGFPLGAAAIVYWAYRLAGTTSLALTASSATLGVYVFANAPISVATRAIAGLQSVLIPAVWGQLARQDGDTRWTLQAERITVAIALVAGATTGLAQALFGPMVLLLVPNFAPAVRLFNILALTIFLLPVATIPSLVLDSARVNRQGLHLKIWIGALILNYVVNAAVLAMGFGAIALAVNDVWVQLVVAILLFEISARHIWAEAVRRRWTLYARLAPAFVVAVVLTAILDVNAAQLSTQHPDGYIIAVRCIGTGLVWLALGLLLLRPSGVTWRR